MMTDTDDVHTALFMLIMFCRVVDLSVVLLCVIGMSWIRIFAIQPELKFIRYVTLTTSNSAHPVGHYVGSLVPLLIRTRPLLPVPMCSLCAPTPASTASAH